MSKPEIKDDERDAVINGLAHAAAVYERMPPNWIRLGETRIVQEILERFAPPPRRQCDSAVPMPLRVARKHLAELFKRAEASRSARHEYQPCAERRNREMKETVEIEFGRISEPGKPKRWVWTCPCAECATIPLPLRLHGPFKSLKAAERDADLWVAAAFIAGGGLPSISRH